MTTSSSPTEAGPDAAGLEQRFLELAERWREETQFYSFLAHRFAHPAYQEIIAMGEPAVPWILRELQAGRGHWIDALEQITGEGATAGSNCESRRDAELAWLQWGAERHLRRSSHAPRT